MPAAPADSESVSAPARFEILSRRDLVLLSAFAGMFPLVAIANFYLFVCVTRLELGRWPVFNDPFPAAMPGQALSLSVAFPAVAFPFVSLIAVMLALWGHWRYADFPVWKLLASIVTCAALFLIMARIDPGGFLNWFMD